MTIEDIYIILNDVADKGNPKLTHDVVKLLVAALADQKSRVTNQSEIANKDYNILP